MRRSDIKQLRRRLTCSALRVWQQYTDVEKRLNGLFVEVQRYEVEDWAPEARESALHELSKEAKALSDLATWYKSGHEQLNEMVRFAEQTIREME